MQPEIFIPTVAQEITQSEQGPEIQSVMIAFSEGQCTLASIAMDQVVDLDAAEMTFNDDDSYGSWDHYQEKSPAGVIFGKASNVIKCQYKVTDSGDFHVHLRSGRREYQSGTFELGELQEMLQMAANENISDHDLYQRFGCVRASTHDRIMKATKQYAEFEEGAEVCVSDPTFNGDSSHDSGFQGTITSTNQANLGVINVRDMEDNVFLVHLADVDIDATNELNALPTP